MLVLVSDAPTGLDWFSAITNFLTAVGTLGAVAVALFPAQARDIFHPASAQLLFNPEFPDITSLGDGTNVVMHNLRVRNTSEGGRVLHRCSVVLYAISEWAGDNWLPRLLHVPLPLAWAPFETQPVAIDIRANEDETLNLLWFKDATASRISFQFVYVIQPVFAVGEPRNFPGNLARAGKMRYHVELRADELREPVRATFEVEWDGQSYRFDVRRLHDHPRLEWQK